MKSEQSNSERLYIIQVLLSELGLNLINFDSISYLWLTVQQQNIVFVLIDFIIIALINVQSNKQQKIQGRSRGKTNNNIHYFPQFQFHMYLLCIYFFIINI